MNASSVLNVIGLCASGQIALPTMPKHHSPLESSDIAAIEKLSCRFKELAPGEDFIRQGDHAIEYAIVVEGVVARYHTVASGSNIFLFI